MNKRTEEQIKEELRICVGLIRMSKAAGQPSSKFTNQFYKLSKEYKKFWLKRQVTI